MVARYAQARSSGTPRPPIVAHADVPGDGRFHVIVNESQVSTPPRSVTDASTRTRRTVMRVFRALLRVPCTAPGCSAQSVAHRAPREEYKMTTGRSHAHVVYFTLLLWLCQAHHHHFGHLLHGCSARLSNRLPGCTQRNKCIDMRFSPRILSWASGCGLCTAAVASSDHNPPGR